jgi:predicted acetyltransferase
MAVEIRPATQEELGDFKRVAANSLLLSPDSFAAMEPDFTLCAFEDGRLSTSYAAWPLTMRFNGQGVPVAAVTTVGTFPVYRRRGYLRKVITAHFQQLHERGERPIAILYASLAAIYQRYGYAVVSTQNAYHVEPRYLQFALPRPVPGRFREAGDEEFPLLVNLYRRFREERTGYLHRGRAMWEAGALAPPPSGGFLHKVVYEEEGEALGYLIYTLQPGAGRLPSHILTIRDLVYLTMAAYRAAWSYLANMDLVATINWGRVPVDDPLPHLLLEPKQLGMTSSDGLLGRIVEVEQALTARRYDEEGTLTFELVDELCPWNQGRWKLETSPQGSSVSRTSEAPQLAMPVSTLAMLVFGQISPTEAARMERLDVAEPASLRTWDHVMRTRYRPACADMF